ncbi:P-loop ATPase, Sll1717 family [Massilia eurypsychrophila]|nr:hypothetical protein [Massilia eurypsychrophila]
MEYKDIKFGELSAEEEIDKSPDLVTDGFYDFKSVSSSIINDREFLVLGNKGSGKSIVGENLKAKSGLQPDGSQLFVSKFGMKDFPFKSFSKIIPGDEGPETKLPTVWQWALLVQVILSFKNDLGKDQEFNSEFNRAVENLTKIGILPSTSISELARISGTNEFKIKLMSFELSGDLTPTKANMLMFSQIIGHLKGIAEHLQSPNKHFIIIDGLDDQLSEKNNQLLIISALISESGELNKLFREQNVPMKIVILCRKDIYQKLPGANKNKLSNYTVTLNWYEDQIDTNEKHIIKLAQFRAAKSGLQGNLFDTNFQKKYDDKDSVEYLLDNTRYTPRDFLRLLTEIQGFKAKSSTVSYNDLVKSVKKYSTDYFWPEIEDELDGYFSRKDISILKQALIHFHKREFKFLEFSMFLNGNKYELPDLKRMLEVMYDCGAISNRTDNGNYFSKMRDGNDFNERHAITLHRGALKALGL